VSGGAPSTTAPVLLLHPDPIRLPINVADSTPGSIRKRLIIDW
jgi:hypothetical protein